MSQELLPSSGCCTTCSDTPVTVNVPGPQGPAGTNGTNGADGENAYTTLSAKFTIPALGATSTVGVVNPDCIPTSLTGQIWVAITGAGYFQVISKSGSTLTLQNPASGVLAVPNTAPTTQISAGTLIAVAGGTGAVGAAGTSGAPDSARYLTLIPDSGLSAEVALSSYSAGYMKTAGSGGSGAVSTTATIPVGDITGTLPIANGGTGVTTTPANGAIPIGTGSGYTVTTLTAGSGISITNASGSITISATSATLPTATFSCLVSGSSGSATCPVIASATTNNPFNATTYSSAGYSTIDTASGFTSSNGRYTVQSTGKYRISASLNLKAQGSTSNVIIYIRKNGTPIYTSFQISVGTSGYHPVSVEYFDSATGGSDYYELYLTTSQNLEVDQGSAFSVFRTS